MHFNPSEMTDLDIARKVVPQAISQIIHDLGIPADQALSYGRFKAKLPLSLINPSKVAKSHLILVSAISPTPAGEGKTTTTIGLADAMNLCGFKTVAALREPSLGPVFGMKGGATGGGHAQVIPMEDINLNFTGDFSAIEKAHNLLAALIDNNLQNKKYSLNIDPETIAWKRVMDMNDRSLRQLEIGLGSKNGVPRKSGFDITAASEVMAILCLSNNIDELKYRLGNIFIGLTVEGKPVYARDLKAQGAMAALLKDAMLPNIVQTLEHNPVIIHGGPFANIAQGTNSVIATKMAMSLGDFVVTEAGFGFDLGGEKFLDIKCRLSGLHPKAVVLVATIRALKYHGGAALETLKEENIEALHLGMHNLHRHVENARKFGLQPFVAINHFTFDTGVETEIVMKYCRQWDVEAYLCRHWAEGAAGAVDLARAVAEYALKAEPDFKPIYELDQPVQDKIGIIAREIYGASEVVYSPKALLDLERIAQLGYTALPICFAKTQYSFTDDPKQLGDAQNFAIHIREIELATGAGFIIPIAGDIMRMPGLPNIPAAENIDIDNQGNISGLF